MTEFAYRWRPAAATDAETVWSWWTAAHAVYWSVAARLPVDPGPAAVRRYLDDPPHPELHPLIAVLGDGRPFAYAELYTARHSALATLPAVDPDARGMHLLIAAEAGRARPSAVRMVAEMIDREFATRPALDQFVGDPDVRNMIIETVGRRVGMREIGIAELPHKTARVMAVRRDRWQEIRTTLLGPTPAAHQKGNCR